jgi:hypothetical protein
LFVGVVYDLSVLGKIAFYMNRRDEVPNQQLAKELAETENTVGLKGNCGESCA